MKANRRPCTLVIGDDAFIHSPELVDGLRTRFRLRVARCASGAFRSRRALMLLELTVVARLLVSPHLYRRRTVLVGGASPYAVLVVSRALAAFGRRLDVFVYNFYFRRLGENVLVRRVLASLLTGHVVVAVQSQADLDYFRSLSESVRLVFVPYGQGAVEGVSDADVRLGDYVFAGGYSNRDYDRLLRCARSLPAVPFVIACSSLNRLTESVPDNVDVQRDLEPRRFHQLLAGARLVVIPLADEVGASGQMVALAAMQLGKALVVANSEVVAAYIVEGVTGIVYERTSDASLADALRAMVGDETLLLQFGSAGRQRYEELYTKSVYDRRLLEALDEALTTSPPRPVSPT